VNGNNVKCLYFKTPKEWRAWLHSNHDKETELWLIFYKKYTKKPTIDYETAVEEALCFGWIDSIIKKIDESAFARKFTPRKNNSNWSPSNKKRVERLIISGRMTNAGLLKIKAAQKSGHWDETDRPTIDFDPPENFIKALNDNRKAKEFFEQLAPAYKKQFNAWIRVAKRQSTIGKRIRESIQLLEKGKKLGLK
jgi:uncharacterized protein YdeI (YjbR/CyaY-like superfamily)